MLSPCTNLSCFICDFAVRVFLAVLDFPFSWFLHILYGFSRRPREDLSSLSCSEVDALDIETILLMVNALPRSTEFGMQNVHFISDCRILKSHMLLQSARSELMAMELVRSQTTIPVPRARKLYDGRHIEQGYGNGFVLMDRIPGATRLASRWPSLSLWQKIVVVLTMRNYLRQIRHVRSPAHALTPGPLGSGPQDCDGLQFGDHTDMPLERRMFDSSADLAGFYERWLRYFRLLVARGHVQGTPPPEPLPVGCFSPLVFTHNDLNMRNIIMDDTDTLWIIDWAWSGFYPPSFEYLAMRFAGQLDDAPADWQWAVRFMAEPAFDIEDWMISIGIRWDNW